MKSRISQKDIILKLLRQRNDWIVSHQLEKVSTPFGWLGTAALRRCRELEEAGLIHNKRENGYVWYRASKPKEIVNYKVDGLLVAQKTIW